MGDEAFDGQTLTEKLSKLNSSQQSIESLSRWCTSFRKKAKQIVETWDKLFKSAQKEQRVAFLYLANDILQNSRRKGSEFVNEFWKVLPAALKQVYESGHESGKKVASRLVDIWEERKVFGSRGQLLKDEVLGKNPSLPVSNGKNPNPIKVIKRDAHSLRIKLAVGDLPEKIITAFQVVHDENTNEKAALNKCKDALSHFKEMEKDIANISSHGTPQGSEMADKIQEQENVLQQCVTQLENSEASRVALISQLMEAVQDEESKLELIRNDMKAAHKQIEQAANMRKRLTSPSLPIEAAARAAVPIPPSAQLTSVVPLPTIPVTSFASSKPTDEESKRAAAAAVAAKLAASTSSAQMLTSVLSSLVAEEAAASMSSGLKRGFSSNLAYGSPEKRPKLDNPGTFSDMNKADGGGSAYFSTGMQSLPQTNPMPAAFPPPPPPPPIPPANSPPSQLVQSAAMMMGVLPYGYGSAGSLPPPPMPIATGLTRPPPLQPPQQPTQQQLQIPHSQQQQQQPVSGGFYPPPGFGFYGQSPQTTPPPVPRQ